MGKANIINSNTVKTELERLHPEEGDVFILNIDTSDPDIIYSDEVADSVEQLSEILTDLTGLDIPILIFGNELNMSMLKKEEIMSILNSIEDINFDIDDEEEENDDTENLTDIFN